MNWWNNACKAKSSQCFHACSQMLLECFLNGGLCSLRGMYSLPAFKGNIRQPCHFTWVGWGKTGTQVTFQTGAREFKSWCWVLTRRDNIISYSEIGRLTFLLCVFCPVSTGTDWLAVSLAGCSVRTRSWQCLMMNCEIKWDLFLLLLALGSDLLLSKKFYKDWREFP